MNNGRITEQNDTKTNKGKPELLAPAGNLEKLKTALVYGADAVYIGGERYGLRAKADNFTIGEMREGIEFAHEMGKNVYIALNIFPHNSDLDGFCDNIKKLREIGADAFIVSDPGYFQIINDTTPDIDVHISTQANVTNYMAARFWHRRGAKRVILSRELLLEEIKGIRENIPEEMEIECFVHGAVCVSYSGRCYLSQYMAGRDANRGDCSQPCRWSYALMEEKREGEYFPVFEDERGAYVLNSKDLRMVGNIPELVSAGISSFKIEGRMKSAYYVASTVKAYRSAIDDYFESPEKYYGNINKYIAETEKSSHREYFKGFYFGGGDSNSGQTPQSSSYIRGYAYTARVLDYDDKTRLATVSQRNRFRLGEEMEVLCQNGDGFTFTVTEIFDENGQPAESAPHPEQVLKIRVPEKVAEYNMLRRAQS